MSSLGRHILVEFFGCSPEVMNDVSKIETSMVDAADKAGATVINSTFHYFSPYGVSGVVVIQESHLAIHTWPEYQYAAVDLFTCGDTVNPWISFDHLKKEFGAKNYSALEIRRGSTELLERIDFNVDEIAQKAKNHINPGKYNRNVWFTDKDENSAYSLRHTGEILFDQTSPYQKVRIYDTYGYGKMLAIDNMVMCTERDEAHYHEMIAHPAMNIHPEPKNILVIGGGDGGTIREVLKHPSVEKVTMVEIDELVIEASKKHLPSLSGEFDNPKLDLRIEDGIEFVKNAAPETYDIILVDGSDPVGPAEGLFSDAFYQDCKKALKSNGILVAQGESPMFNNDAFVDLHRCLADTFGTNNTFVYLYFATSYPTGMWSFQWASKGNLHPVKDVNESKIEDFTNKNDLTYYNLDIHKGAFALPTFVKKQLLEVESKIKASV
jgi:spermidine synthase